MKVIASIKQELIIDPIEVIERLIDKKTGENNWFLRENKKYYRCWYQSAGQHSFEEREEITKTEFEYVEHLNKALKYLKNEKVQNS